MEGFKISWSGQEYRFSAKSTHRKPDGSVIPVLLWHTDCPDCHSQFEIMTTMTFRDPRRRCDACKSPGLPVRGHSKALSAERIVSGVKSNRLEHLS
jgi:hypothetical protein